MARGAAAGDRLRPADICQRVDGKETPERFDAGIVRCGRHVALDIPEVGLVFTTIRLEAICG